MTADVLRRDIRRMKEAFPSWSSPEALLKRLNDVFQQEIQESDIFTNSSGHITVTLDTIHIVIFPDDERPGLYCYGVVNLADSVYVDAND